MNNLETILNSRYSSTRKSLSRINS